MTDIKHLPPLPVTPWCGLVHQGGPYEPEWTSNQDGYTEDDMRDYASAAVAAVLTDERLKRACDAVGVPDTPEYVALLRAALTT